MSYISIDTKARGASLGDFYGIFFEDINHSSDGGLYAQMVRNSSFEFCALDNKSYTALTAWEPVGDTELTVKERGGCLPKNPHFVEITSLSQGRNGIRNLGYGKGMYFAGGEKYELSFFAKGAMDIRVALEDGDRNELSALELRLTDSWERYRLSLISGAETETGALSITFDGDGRIALDAVELFPADTYKNGVYRRDLAEALEELKPKFMRFPGGCLVHDGDLDPESRGACYCWKNTIGAPEARPARRNNWGYNQSLGLGYYEYFLLCEHFGCEPLPVLPAGWNPHRHDACPIENMQPWIDDALDLIEFANGDAETHWGRVRAELGHPKPFRLKYLAIGNEEVGEEFPERWRIIADAVRERYPKIKLIHSAGPFSSGSEYERGYKAAKADKADLIDEHYYCSPEWFLANIHRYDKFPARKPKVFLGEYASCGNDLRSALAEAAYMTGLENAAHAVSLACYAPLLCHVDYVNWRPDLIWFDNHRVCRTPNYYVQQLFSANLGDYILPVSGELKSFRLPSPPISGAVELVSDGIEGWLWDVRVINLDNGDTVNFGNFDLSPDFKNALSIINLTNFELRFNFKKGGGRADKGIYVNFGKNGDENRLCWEIGGWQNQDCLISSCINNRSTCLDQHIFNVETGTEYELCLHVEGRKITTIVNGAVMNTCEDKIPTIEELYVTASKIKKTGEVIIKAVNVRNESCRTAVNLGGDYEGTLYLLTGESADATNTFDKEAVAPVEMPITLTDGGEVEFPPLSVTVMKVREK